MNRRGFLRRLTAAAAAFTAVAASGGAKAMVPYRGVAITADTSKFEKALGETGKRVAELLRQCRVVQVEERVAVGELRRFRAVFKMANKSAPLTHLDEQAWRMVERGHLTEVTVSEKPHSIVDLNHGFKEYRGSFDYEIEATWLVPAS